MVASPTPTPPSTNETVRQAVTVLLRMTDQTAVDLAAAMPANSVQTWRRRIDGVSPFKLPELEMLAGHFGVSVRALLGGPMAVVRDLAPEAVQVDRRGRRRPKPAPQPVEVPTGNAARRATRRYPLHGYRPDGVTRLLHPALRRVA